MHNEYLRTACLVGAHGIAGEMKFSLLGNDYEHVHKLISCEVMLEHKPNCYRMVRISNIRGVAPRLLCAIEGITDRDSAQDLRGSFVWLKRDMLHVCQEDEFYYADLEQCAVYYNTIRCGHVISVFDAGYATMLEIYSDTRAHSVLIPFQKHFIGMVDIQKKYIELTVDWFFT